MKWLIKTSGCLMAYGLALILIHTFYKAATNDYEIMVRVNQFGECFIEAIGLSIAFIVMTISLIMVLRE